MIAVLVGAALLGGIGSTQARSPFTGVKGVAVADKLVLGPPLAPARLTAEQVVAIARQTVNPEFFTHPYTVEYGTWDDKHQSVDGKLVGKIDAWKIRITGLSLRPPSGGASGTSAEQRAAQPSFTTFIVIIDDKTGRYRRAEAHL